MSVTVLLFASAADIARQRCVTVEVSTSATLSELSEALRAAYPELTGLLGMSRWAVDREFAPLSTHVLPGQEIALIPPVSGG